MAKNVKELLSKVKDSAKKIPPAAEKPTAAKKAVESVKAKAEKKPAKAEKPAEAKQPVAEKAAKPAKKALVVVQDASPAHKFDYTVITEKAAREFAKGTAEKIRVHGRTAITTFVEIGLLLLAVKEKLQHGTFLLWAEAEVGYTARHVQNFMRVASRFGDRKDLEELKLAPTALIRLSDVEDEQKFESLIAMAKKERLTESRIQIELAGGRTSAPDAARGPKAPEQRGNVAGGAEKGKGTGVGEMVGAKKDETVAERGRRYLDTIRQGSVQIVSSVVALENLPDPRTEKDRKEAEDVATAIRAELRKILEHVTPFFSIDEIDEINHTPERKQISATQADQTAQA